MPETASPTEVFHRLVDAIAERRQSEIVDECYAEDVVVEHPFMIPEPTTTSEDRLELYSNRIMRRYPAWSGTTRSWRRVQSCGS